MLYIALNCNDIINTADDEMVFINRINELKKSIEKQENDINELKTQEPFCFEKQINDKNWVEERKKQLRNKLVQLNKKITYNDQLIKKIIKC
ncbi:hypothetical protein SDC9_134919 [bioreactor metagenome]|uniref:Uncharacterized protein n=1 Tax=bioreactor metagenome TaxID=1076179 RepID=A0A645DEX7_9ZZZZ